MLFEHVYKKHLFNPTKPRLRLGMAGLTELMAFGHRCLLVACVKGPVMQS